MKNAFFYASIIGMSFYITNYLVDSAMEFEFETVKITVSNDTELLGLDQPIHSANPTNDFPNESKSWIENITINLNI